MIELPDSSGLIASLLSETCPACGGPKRRRQTLCFRDYRRLPADAKAALYDRVGQGYEEAVESAFRHLGVETFTPPPARPGPERRGPSDAGD